MSIAPPLPTSSTRHRPRFLRSVVALMLREMVTRFGGTPGGYIWTIAEPVGGIAMMVLIFTVGLKLRTPALGINFPLFFATGMLVLSMYLGTCNSVQRSLTASRTLLTYPGIGFIEAITARFMLELLTKLVIVYIVLGGILLLFETRTIIDLPPILAALGLAAALGLGMGCLNAYLIPTFPLWDSVWGILTTPLFLMSGIFFIYEDLPEIGQDVLWYNPLIHLTGLMRTGFYPTYEPVYISVGYVGAWVLTPMAFGLLLLRKHHRRILNL
ncbi:MAG: ABC transporter permease [Rhodobacteraceae bacterium]|jgi:capsular polysaccharide transport system permease protein|nr:ABC transporter permease [Paracoccaceae bacterium]